MSAWAHCQRQVAFFAILIEVLELVTLLAYAY